MPRPAAPRHQPGHGLRLAQELRYLKLPAGPDGSVRDGLFSFEFFGTAHRTNATPPDWQH